MPGQAGGVHDQRLAAAAQPDDTAGRLQLLVVLADDANARLGLEEWIRLYPDVR